MIKVFNKLKGISFLNVYKSEANYFLCKITKYYSASKLSEMMIEKNIYIKDLTGKIGFQDKNYIRIAVRDKIDNNLLIKNLQEFDKHL